MPRPPAGVASPSSTIRSTSSPVEGADHLAVVDASTNRTRGRPPGGCRSASRIRSRTCGVVAVEQHGARRHVAGLNVRLHLMCLRFTQVPADRTSSRVGRSAAGGARGRRRARRASGLLAVECAVDPARLPLGLPHPLHDQRASMVTLTNSPPAQRIPPASRWSANGSAQVSSSDGYQSPPSSVGALHDRQPEHRVERRGQEHQQRPGRVRPPVGQRVEAQQRPEEQAAGHDEVHVDELVQPRVLQGGR